MTAADRLLHYWNNHTAFHWQPPGQALACRRGVLATPHSAAELIPRLPRLP